MNDRPRYFRLGPGHEVQPVDVSTDAELLAWARDVWGDDKGRRVAFTEVGPGVEVSTVFLGIDHSFFGDGPPVVFETMTFDDYGDGGQWRYSTWDEAVAGHAAAVAELKARISDRATADR